MTINPSLAGDIYEIAPAIYAKWVLRMHADGRNISARSEFYSIPRADLFGLVEDLLKQVAGEAQVLQLGDNSLIGESPGVFIKVRSAVAGQDNDAWKFSVRGDKALVDKVMAAIKAPLFRSSVVHWWYMSQGTPTSAPMPLDKPFGIQPLMYPQKGLNCDPMGFMEGYNKSSASILFLLGPPGTGKTSLIREFLWANQLSAAVTYDEKVLQNDAMFIQFLGSRNRYGENHPDTMVLEDVTEMLQNREMAKNELMARFLNVSDGLIQFPNKKIIFTTNLASLKDVDPALLRPGRCYAVIEMRALFYDEAVAACKAAGLPIPLEKRDYMMSELYNQGREVVAKHKVGII